MRGCVRFLCERGEEIWQVEVEVEPARYYHVRFVVARKVHVRAWGESNATRSKPNQIEQKNKTKKKKKYQHEATHTVQACIRDNTTALFTHRCA